MAFQSYNDLLRVIVRATYRRFRRNHMRGLYEAKLTRSQILDDLERQHGQYGLASRGSMRSLTRWLAELERAKFIRRTFPIERDRFGRVRWKLIQFSFGPVGIQWIKTNMPDALIGVSRTMWPKLAARFVNPLENLKLAAPVDRFAVDKSSPPLARGESTAPKSAALRRRTSASASTRARQAPRAAARPLVRKGAGRAATIAQAARKRAGRGGEASKRQRRSKRAVARRRG